MHNYLLYPSEAEFTNPEMTKVNALSYYMYNIISSMIELANPMQVSNAVDIIIQLS